MPGTARRPLFAAVVLVVIFAFVGAQAFGGLNAGSSVPNLQTPAGLGGSVSTPSVPQVDVPSVSVPHVSAPSTPSPSTVAGGAGRALRGAPSSPSTPSLRSGVRSPAGSAAGAGTGATSRGSAASAAGLRTAAAGGRHAASNGGVRAAAARSRAAAHARALHERKLRRAVTRFAGCIGQLGSLEGRLLELRGGIGAAPVSRHAAAERLGISVRRARTLERGGLRHLRSAAKSTGCGSSSFGNPRSAAALAADGSARSQLQPAVLLTPRPALKSPAALAGPRGHHGVKGAHASSGDSGVGGAAKSAAKNPPAIVRGAQAASKTAGYLIALAVLAMLLAIVLITWRRRNIGRAPAYQAPAGVWWPASADQMPEAPAGERPQVTSLQADAAEPAPGPIIFASEPDPVPAATPAAAPEPETWVDPLGAAARAEEHEVAPGAQHPQRRPAAVVAASLVSLGVTALLGRRRRRR